MPIAIFDPRGNEKQIFSNDVDAKKYADKMLDDALQKNEDGHAILLPNLMYAVEGQEKELEEMNIDNLPGEKVAIGVLVLELFDINSDAMRWLPVFLDIDTGKSRVSLRLDENVAKTIKREVKKEKKTIERIILKYIFKDSMKKNFVVNGYKAISTEYGTFIVSKSEITIDGEKERPDFFEIGKNKLVDFRIDSAVENVAKDYANSKGITFSQLVKEAIREM